MSTPYQRPPIGTVIDPNRMNWVWKLVSALMRLTPAEVVDACAAAGIAIPKNRVKAWSYAEDNPDFSAMNATELERTLRALLGAKRQQAEGGDAEFLWFLQKCRDAVRGGEEAWHVMSTGEKVGVALALNRADWLAEFGYTIPEAIERLGPAWLAVLPAVVRRLGDDQE